jgi:hypothetical protein
VGVCAVALQGIRKFLEPSGMYKRKATYDFLWKFTELNFKLKYVAGDKVMSFANAQKEAAAQPQKN